MSSRPDLPPRPARGSLSRARILETALQIADQSGLEALSMRRLGAELGVEAMSLYNHVPNKAALLDGMVEVMLEDMASPGVGGPRGDQLAEMARAFRGALRAHPGAASLFATRPAVTKASLKHVESALGLLRELGLSRDESLSALQVLVTFVVGHTLSQLGPARDDEVASPRYEDLSREEFPNVTEIAALIPEHDGEAEFELGLDAFLRGLRARVKRGPRVNAGSAGVSR